MMTSVPSGHLFIHLLDLAIKAILILVMSSKCGGGGGVWGGSNCERDNMSHMCPAAVTDHMKQKKVGASRTGHQFNPDMSRFKHC